MARLDPRWLVQSADRSGFDQMTDSRDQEQSAFLADSKLAKRLMRRAKDPVGVIGVGHALRLHGRASFLAGRSAVVDGLIQRYGVNRDHGAAAEGSASFGPMPWSFPAGRALPEFDRLWFRPHIAALAGAIGLSVYGAACGQASRRVRVFCARAGCAATAVERQWNSANAVPAGDDSTDEAAGRAVASRRCAAIFVHDDRCKRTADTSARAAGTAGDGRPERPRLSRACQRAAGHNCHDAVASAAAGGSRRRCSRTAFRGAEFTPPAGQLQFDSVCAGGRGEPRASSVGSATDADGASRSGVARR